MNGDKKNILVTGGAGFIGSKVVYRLKEQGHDVVIADIATRQGERSIDVLAGGYVSLLVSEADVVVHLIGLPDAHYAQRDPQQSFKLNVESLLPVLNHIRLLKTKPLVIIPSSAAVYGVTQNSPITEDQSVNPAQIYAYHKVMAEQLIRAYGFNYGIPYLILRLFNVYGSNSKGIISSLVDKAERGEETVLFGWNQLRDYVYIDEVANAFVRATTQTSLKNRAVNIGSGKGVSVVAIADLVKSVHGLDFKIAKHDPEGFVPYNSVADVSLAKAMGWEPQRVGVEAILKVIEEEL